ncbi:tetratricopeptide repeat protein [Lysinibacillus fusiformis]|uniref:tetratricopeptide repeat protein n=1 Tax=Lysinibacillus fusiformis TaxID=28031 RepID=UPI003D03A4B2
MSGIVAFIVIGLVVANVLANKQDEDFMMSDTLYDHAVQLQASGDLEGAEAAILEVLKNQPNSEIANYLAGLTAAQNDDFKKASIHMQKVLAINPYKVEDPRFMVQLGEVFLGAEKYDEAKVVLLRCQESQWTLEDLPNYQEHVAELLAQIENLQLKEGTNNE